MVSALHIVMAQLALGEPNRLPAFFRKEKGCTGFVHGVKLFQQFLHGVVGPKLGSQYSHIRKRVP